MFSKIAVTGLLGALVVCACSQDNPGPALRITPSGDAGTVQISGPTKFTAELANSGEQVSWAVTGGATLSSTTGFDVVYTPPLGTASGTLTATAGDVKATVQVSSVPVSMTAKTIAGLTAPVTIQNDAQDIPHIQCAAALDCLAVQGYVQARDRLFPMDFTRHVAESRVAELIGFDGLAQDVSLRTLLITRAGHRIEDDLAAALDATTRAQLEAYARGVNAYLAELRATPGAALPGEYAQLPFQITAADIEPWRVEDTLAIGRLQAFQLSETIEPEMANGVFAQFYGPQDKDPLKVDAWIRAAAPSTERAHTLSGTASQVTARAARSPRPTFDLAAWKAPLTQATAAASALRNVLRPGGAEIGSNNWVVAPAKTANHLAMLANDPHLPLQYPPLFHLSVLTSTNPADNLDLAGGVFAGLPGALVGRGKHVAWGVTVVGYDVTDIYLEQFPALTSCTTPAPCVMFNGVPTPLIVVPQTFKVRVGAGSTGVVVANSVLPADKQLPAAVLVVPHHGPIVQRTVDAVGAGTGASVRWTGHEGNTQDSKAIFGLNTAVDVDAAVQALKGFSTGAQNFVLADDQGNIAYDPHALVPVRNFADIGKIRPWFPLPGTGFVGATPVNTEWGDGTSDCASATLTPVPATCWISDDALPHGKNPAKGYFFTANADPTATGVSDDNDPLAHPPYLSFDWDDSTGFRATRVQEMIDAAIAKGGVSLEDMQAIQSDHVSRPGKAFAPYIDAIAPSGSSPPELAKAKTVLQQWGAGGWNCPSGLTGSDPLTSPVATDAATVQGSSGCFLFHAFLRTLLNNVFADELAAVKLPVDGIAAVKAMLYMLGLDATTDAGKAASKFCSNVNPAGDVATEHSCADQVASALVQAYTQLSSQVSANPSEWVWGRVHTIRPVSLLPLVTTNYEPGPYARPGGAFTVDVGSPNQSDRGLVFGYRSGGNVRHISVMDPTTPVVKMQLPGPEHDGPTLFGAGPDLLGQWVKNIYFDFAFGNQINGVAVSTQSFHAP